jgi:tetratricopeptide (TPR) repeat protein/tRNA A-37 threonylcarbamoyl transferase component Bud32
MSFSRSQWDQFLTPGGGVAGMGKDLPKADDMLGSRLGAFELVEVIGVGGMASVFRGERADGQFEQSVAIKVMHAGLEDEQLQQRFRQERQILAKLDHPGIARVFEGGVTEDGRPYLVMDVVRGKSIDQWCREQQATLTRRLESFLEVIDAVQYAHGHLVVHCDLKPANILIDDKGRARLLDFGIAQVFSGGLGQGDEIETAFRPFTPLYAAPEQLRGQDAQVATDVWQLGLLLFELVTEAHPWRGYGTDLARLTSEILDGEPARPSDLANSGTGPEIDAGRWQELDAIVACCLNKQPADRYVNVLALSQDLQSLLAHRPVAAVGGQAGYRASRFIHRHQLTLGISAGVLIAMAGLAWWGQSRVDDQRDRAEAMAAFVGSMVATRDPLAGQFQGLELISGSSFEPPVAVTSDPVLQREFVLLSGKTLINFGDFDRIIELVAPLADSLIDAPPEDTRLAEYLSLLGYARFRSGQVEAGRSDLTRALDLMSGDWGEADSRRLTARRLAQVEQSAGRFDRARAVLESILDRSAKDPDSAPVWLDLGLVAGEQGDYPAAIAALEQAVALGQQGALKVSALAALADAQRLSGQLAQAIERADQAVSLAGNDAGMRATALVARANVRRADNQFAAAVDDYRAALGTYRATLGEDHRDTGVLTAALATTLMLDQRCPAAIPLFDDAIRIAQLNGQEDQVLTRLQEQRKACR